MITTQLHFSTWVGSSYRTCSELHSCFSASTAEQSRDTHSCIAQQLLTTPGFQGQQTATSSGHHSSLAVKESGSERATHPEAREINLGITEMLSLRCFWKAPHIHHRLLLFSYQAAVLHLLQSGGEDALTAQAKLLVGNKKLHARAVGPRTLQLGLGRHTSIPDTSHRLTDPVHGQHGSCTIGSSEEQQQREAGLCLDRRGGAMAEQLP
ncbi:uncharacterized protein LOC141934740 [Strix aluco]|uniref:uncharacterized protein LOC141934740 n=1 Tax=Strix aluco TaxID=111821 RepID=UPI003DA6C59C